MRTFFCLLLLPLVVHARVIEIQQIEETLPYLKDSSFVIMDIDNTLIKTPQQLGSDQWFYHRFHLHKKYHSHEIALQKALAEWHKTVTVTSVLPVEEGTKKVMDTIFQSGIPVIALTTRGFWLEGTTSEQLASIGINFAPSSPTSQDLLFDNQEPILFRRGILYTNGTHKGKALYFLLDHLKINPKNILFVNDKKTHLLQLGETVEERGALFTGLRYGYLDDEVAHFNPEIADIQWQHFGALLSDDEAFHLLNLQKN